MPAPSNRLLAENLSAYGLPSGCWLNLLHGNPNAKKSCLDWFLTIRIWVDLAWLCSILLNPNAINGLLSHPTENYHGP